MALLSFIHFLNPGFFAPIKESGEKVLGVRQINQAANIGTVREALTIYCIEHNALPPNLNQLYNSELSRGQYLDLDANFAYQKGKDCGFQLIPKN